MSGIGMFTSGSYTSTVANPGEAKAITAEDLERMAEVIGGLEPEPFGEWMRQQGKPPERWILMMPGSLRDGLEFPAFTPDYVRFSNLIDRPMFMSREMMGRTADILRRLAR